MKQKIRFVMRYSEFPDGDSDLHKVQHSICPEGAVGLWVMREWMRRTGMRWWPIIGRRVS